MKLTQRLCVYVRAVEVGWPVWRLHMKSCGNVAAACQGRAGQAGDTQRPWMERKKQGLMCGWHGDMAAVAICTVQGSSAGWSECIDGYFSYRHRTELDGF